MLSGVWSAGAQFFAWWRDELAGLVPGVLAGGAAGPSVPRRVLSLESDGVRLIETRGAGSAAAIAATRDPQPLAEVLRQLGRDASSGRGQRAATAVGLRLPHAACFERRVELPRSAARDFARLLVLDLERVTPFKPRDVLTAHYLDPVQESPARSAFRQLVVKRTAVEGAITAVTAAGFDVVRLDCWSADGETALPLDFLAAAAPPVGVSTGALTTGLAAVITLLVAAAGWLAIDRHETALGDIQVRQAQLKAKVQARRDAEGRLQASIADVDAFKRVRSASPSKLAALEELSRLLPDTAWVTDLRIEGTTIDVSGLASQAVQLVPILERSAYFRDATLTSPLTFDQREDKERFSIRVRFRNVLPTDTAEGGQ